MFEEDSGRAALVDRICAASRAENRAAGQRLVAIGELDALWLRQVGERETWVGDTFEEIAAEVGAALRIGQGLAASYLKYARALRNRLPKVGAVLVDGDIGYLTFQAIVHRTELITDSEALAAVDAKLALRVPRWPSMTRARLNQHIDRVGEHVDADAVRRRREAQAHRELSFWDTGDGLAGMYGRLERTDAKVVENRVNAIAATVCESDPRTRSQRRADALGALAAGAERLQCQCATPQCPADPAPVPMPVVIHVVAEQPAGYGTPAPGAMIGADGLVSPELLAELAAAAKLLPLVHPADTAPESGRTPSKALADFVRCRDLTCRFPGCDRPVTHADIDHTIPFDDGGATHASNLKCLCRLHHLLKTFWGWRDQQLPDGTVIWTSPSGYTYVTTPGSALLFPSLCAPTSELPPVTPRPETPGANREAKMPTRTRTRAENRARYVAVERRHNRTTRLACQKRRATPQSASHSPPSARDDEPPPF
jgi:hypothetical protein